MAKKGLCTRFKMLTLWNKIGALGSIASILGLILFFASSFPDGNNVEVHNQLPQEELYIKSARFEPTHTFFVRDHGGHENDFYETAFLHITVLNLSNQEIIITSLEVIDVNNRGILSPAYSSSGLGSEISKNKPVKIAAGSEVEISSAGGFRFRGLVDVFDLKDLSNEYYIANVSPKISQRNNLVIELNQKLKTLLSGESKIKIKFFTGKNTLIAEHIFNITSGSNIFDDTGKVQHPYFLGDLIHQLRSPYLKDILNKSINFEPSARDAQNTRAGY